jgi:hypothetical protein
MALLLLLALLPLFGSLSRALVNLIRGRARFVNFMSSDHFLQQQQQQHKEIG